jgi:arabinogalactan endo-1,4-beta-galactosidase
MLNQFDFYSVSAHSHSKRSLKQMCKEVGINYDTLQITTHVDRSGRWPKNSYSATLKYFDVVHEGHHASSVLANTYCKQLPKIGNVLYFTNFYAVD